MTTTTRKSTATRKARSSRKSAGGKSKKKSDAQASVDLAHDEIASRARAIWHANGCPGDSATDDWYEAEAQLRAERRKTK